MKITIILLLTIIFSFPLCAQELTQQEKQRIIDSLDSNNNRENYNALLNVEKYNIVEAIPKLESKAQNGDCTAIYLRLLQKLGSYNVQSLAHIAIDSSNKCYDPVETRYDCSKILIELGDYSAAEYIIDYYNNKASKYFFDITLIPKIIDNRPDLLQQSKTVVFDYAQNFRGSSFTRYIANAIIADKYPNDAVPVLVNSFRNEPDDASRILSLWLLFVIDYSELPELMRERLVQEPVPSYRYIIADSLLKEFGTLQNYRFVKEYAVNESDEVTRSLIENEVEIFVPVPPDSTKLTLDLLDNLINYVDSVLTYTWLGDLTFSNELKNILTTAKTNLQNGDSLTCRVQVKTFQDLVDNVYKDSLNSDPRFVTIEGWKFLYWNAQYILDRLPEPQANPNLLVNLKNSLGNQIEASNVMYYESATSGWKDAVNNGDGTFTVITTKPTVSVRMFYEYANQTVHNVTAQNNTYTFITVNAAVELRNSSGNLMPAPSGDQGTVQYYADAWRTFGTTSNGVAYKELLPINYSFRMTYEYVPNDKQQDISVNSTVTFATVLCTLKVTNFNNQPLAGASTKYYSTAWRDIGLTNSEGIITKELLPKNLSFRATYGNVSLDKQQDISVNILVEIQLNVP
ncbi:MAG: hypothetical protein HND39_10615 [Ignavibacteriota bacterium]|nr:hypothetical protein [Ignavibacteriota bacterium]MCE7857987.1 hypothetical protein [Ignavibacteria bacterium CHB3]MCZ7614044.1 hypothetical protein [Ignavibacteriaceae bacterium]QKJ96698.1 MAG: hypothetical protein HND39_10615 [Ignavibacteriota bacterium]GJQ43310.1 MAG: hypothetical protein JETCAE03_28080 [Ignavibacteriaceae bacterium]